LSWQTTAPQHTTSSRPNYAPSSRATCGQTTCNWLLIKSNVPPTGASAPPVPQRPNYPVPDIRHLYNTQAPRCPGGPSWPKRVDLAGSWWACRSIELANAVVTDVTSLANGKVSWALPPCKTDQAALGASRSHKCPCSAVAGAPSIVPHDMCPRCMLTCQVTWVKDTFKANLAGNQQVPLFPSETGGFITKSIMVKHIELGATYLG
jgi:hypothetical protein